MHCSEIFENLHAPYWIQRFLVSLIGATELHNDFQSDVIATRLNGQVTFWQPGKHSLRRVAFCGGWVNGAVERSSKGRSGMQESGAGKFWIQQEYDPEYTPSRDISPKRAALNKCPHSSDTCLLEANKGNNIMKNKQTHKKMHMQ